MSAPSFFGNLFFRIDEGNLRIRADQLRARLRLYPVMVGGQAMLAPMFVALLWEQAPQRGLLLWLVFMLSLHAVEMLVWNRYRRQTGTIDECRHWNRRFILMTTAVGLSWGSTAWLFFPADLAYQAMLICVVLGLVAGAVTMNPVYPPSLYIYVLCVTLPLIAQVVSVGDKPHLILAGMLLLFLGMVVNAGRELSKTFLESLRQRHENSSLVELMVGEKNRADRARDEALAANRDKSRFLAAASHDLRQPLQALALFSEALHETAKDGPTGRLSGQIGKSVQALVSMFDELLDVSKLDAGVVVAQFQHFELQPLLDRLYAEFFPFTHTKGLRFEVEPAKYVLYSDPHLLERVLRNLVSNAVRYTEKGGVTVRHRLADGKLRLEVADSGVGIGTEALPHIFEEYYQVGNPHRDRRKGLGLGLAIVRRMESLLGCKVEVASEQGKGSVFSFSVGLGDAASLAQPFEASSRYDLNGVRVALVEDEPDIRQMLVSFMEQWGCKVSAGELPDEVIGQMNSAGMRPDLLVCDYRLPYGLTAVEVILRMRGIWGRGLPVLVLTGDTAPEVLYNIRNVEALLLHKPIVPSQLRSLMHFALHGAEPR